MKRATVRYTVNRILIEHFTKDVELTENHRILSKLPINTYWSTNYDKLIEKALEDAGKTIDVKITEANLAINIPKRDAIVYEMHRDISQPENAVISKGDYELYELDRKLFTTALKGDLVSKTFLFIGLVFIYPNLSYILSRIRILLITKIKESIIAFLRKLMKKIIKATKIMNMQT